MKRILWIEEEAKIELIHYKKPLVRAGYLVDIASDASEAIQLLREKGYDALIFDLIIPAGVHFKTDEFYVGLELLRRLLKGEIEGIKQEYHHDNVMVFSVVNDPVIHQKIRNLGVNTILIKRLSQMTDLKDHVDRLLAKQ